MSEKNTKATENVEIDPGMSVMPEEPGLMDVPTVIPELDSMLAAMPPALPAYQTTVWKNKPSTETPVDAAVMTRVEQRLVDLTTAVNGLRDSVSQALPCTGIGITGDFDNCTKAGAYIVSADSGSSMGFPSGAYKWGTLIVFARQGQYIVQIYIADSVSEPVYLRNSFNGSPFRNWTKIARTSM